jgi:two-component system chemotaxis response regulator CheB
MIVIGASLGGVRALSLVLGKLSPKHFPLPVAVVLHRGKDTGPALLDALVRGSPLPVREALDKEPLMAGTVFLAPPDYHLLIEPTHFCLSVDEPVLFARPSIDVLFESAADAFGRSVIGVILTGASQDGARGAARIKMRGGRLIVQDPETAEGEIMPRAALQATEADYILPPERIGVLLAELTENLV